MTDSNAFEIEETTSEPRKARVVVLGEFSAGKSTLINLLTGAKSLRTQITATQMPPVWMSHGTDEPYRVDLKGDKHPFDFADPGSVPVSETAYIRAFIEAPALELCDFIDTPGNSDPNIASVAWERVAKIADVAIWCTSSTQAWRQSELSAWQEVPENVRERSILLLTRADKLTNDTDREKVLRRIKREAGELFSHIHMVSLINFTNARDVLDDLMTLCNSVDSSTQSNVTVSSAFSDSLLNGVTAEEPATSHTQGTEAETDDSFEDNYEDAFDSDIDVDLSELASSQEEFDDTDDVLAALTATADAATESVEPEAGIQAQADAVNTELELVEYDEIGVENTKGFASELWTAMIDDIPSDDPDAYAVAFDTFLEHVDTEIATLKNQIAMKAAG